MLNSSSFSAIGKTRIITAILPTVSVSVDKALSPQSLQISDTVCVARLIPNIFRQIFTYSLKEAN